MAGLFFLVLIMLSFAGLAAVMLKNNGEIIVLQEYGRENRHRLESVMLELDGQMTQDPLTGIVYPPAGRVGPNYYELPTLNTSVITPWGVPYQYCPFAPGRARENSATVVTVAGSEGGSYSVEVDADGRVISSDQSLSVLAVSKEVLAFVISPTTDSRDMPECSDVRYVDGSYVVSGGIVRVITRKDGFIDVARAESKVVRFYASANGTGSGWLKADKGHFSDALRFWRNNQPRHMEIILDTGTHIADISDFAAIEGVGGGDRILRIVGGSSDFNDTVIQAKNGSNTDAEVTWEFSAGFDVTLDHLFVSSGVTVLASGDSRFEMMRSRVGTLRANLAEVVTTNSWLRNVILSHGTVAEMRDSSWVSAEFFEASVSVNGSSDLYAGSGEAYAAELNGGTIVVNGALRVHAVSGGRGLGIFKGNVLVGPGGYLQTQGVQGAFTESVLIRSGGRLSVDRGTFNILSNPVVGIQLTGGEAVLEDSVVNFVNGATAGANVLAGGHLRLDGSTQFGTVGAKPISGVVSSSEARVSGFGAVIRADDCWNGQMFRHTDSGMYDTQNSKVYTGVSTNEISQLERSLMTGINQSEWSCVTS